jgi:tetratricopeptide (TPR) repeat protein
MLVVGLICQQPVAALARPVEGAATDAAIALAEQKAAQGFDAVQAKRFAEAVALYLEAYAAAPSADMLYNIARIYDTRLGDRPLAIHFYRRYIADPGAVAGRVQIGNERLAALREAELAVPAPALVAPASDWSTAEATGAILAATGVVGIGIGAGFGIAAMAEAHTARRLCDGNVCREQAGIDAAESATQHARVSTIGFASGGVLLALGAALYLWGGAGPSERVEPASVGSLALGARVSQNTGGWSLELNGSW